MISEKIKIIVEALEDKKGENIKILDISEISDIADFFIIVNGSNINQLHALSDSVQEKLAQNKMSEEHIEGYNNANWVLIDCGDVIVHLFDKESRQLYNLERVWRDAKEIEI